MRPSANVALATAAALLGSGVVADRRVASTRRLNRADSERFEPPVPDRDGHLTTSDGVRLYVAETGPTDAALTVVFVHGFTLDHDTFLLQQRALIERFGDRARVLSYDQRSHGQSSRSEAHHVTVEQLGADLELVLKSHVPQGRLILVGHSMGGMTIMALAERRPELFAADGRVDGVVLISTSAGRLREVTLGLPAAVSRVHGRPANAVLKRVGQYEDVVERGRGRATDLAWVLARRFAVGSAVDPVLVEHIAGKQARTPVGVFVDFYPALMRHDKLASLEYLQHIPVVVVSGAADMVTPPAHSAAIAHALPHAHLVTVPRAGHLVVLEQPEAINEPLTELVEQSLAAASR